MSRNYTRKKTGYIALAFLICDGVSSVLADEVTISQPIAEFRYQANADYTYLIGPARWRAPSCPGAYYAMIQAGAPNAKQMFAIALAAKASGANVSFQGNCVTSDPMYFAI